MMRPGSAMRPQSGRPGMVPTGGGPVSARPGSALRPVTGAVGARPGSSAGRAQPQRRALEGTGVIQQPVSGHRRMYMDKNWYQGELRQRVTELNTEIEKLKQEEVKFQRDHEQSYVLDRKMQALQPEVNDLSGRLADYNLLLERIHMSTAALRVEDIMEQVTLLQRKNEFDSKKINDMFTDSQLKEKEITDAEARIYQIQQETDAMIGGLDPEIRASYNQKREENMQMQSEIAEKQQLLDELKIDAQNLEEQLRRDSAKTKSVQLHDELHQLTKTKVELEEETSQQLSVPEEIEKLLQQVKKTNNEIAHIESEASATLDAINKIRTKIAEFERAKEESKTERAEKFRELFKKDKEMSKFIKEYDVERAETQEKIRNLQTEILATLDKTSQALHQTTAMPTRKDAKRLDSDIEFKGRQADLAVTTAERLQQELDHRKQELAKMESLDTKIAEELQSLAQKSEQMRQEMANYGGLESVRSEFQSRKEALAAEKKFLLKRKELIAQQNGMLASENDAKERQLRDSDVHNQLELLEKSIRHYMTTNFVMDDYIKQKEKEGDYKAMISQVLVMVNDLNQRIIKVK